MGRPADDIDIATRLAPEAVIAALKAAGLKAAPTGVEHGTVTAISGRKPYEITTLRQDVETDGRHAVVAFTDDWAEDARRRDFTLNALYAHRDGTIFDPTGHGVADAQAGRIVFVGDPEQRLREDYLRILRFFRFFAWYGRGAADPAALNACAGLKDQLSTLSAERITKELLKLLAAADPREAVRLMDRAGVLAVILPPPLNRARFEALVDLDADPVLRLAALMADDGSIAAAKALRLSNQQRDRLVAALKPGEALSAALSEKDARRLIHALGAEAFSDRVKLAGAGEDLLSLAQAWSPPAFPLNGQDVMRLGVPKGPRVGELLGQVQAWWVAQDFAPDREACLARLRTLA